MLTILEHCTFTVMLVTTSKFNSRMQFFVLCFSTIDSAQEVLQHGRRYERQDQSVLQSQASKWIRERKGKILHFVSNSALHC